MVWFGGMVRRYGSGMVRRYGSGVWFGQLEHPALLKNWTPEIKKDPERNLGQQDMGYRASTSNVFHHQNSIPGKLLSAAR